MKRNMIFAAFALVVALAASCNRKAQYEGNFAFVTFDGSQMSLSVREDVGEFKIPVRVINPTGKAFNVAIAGVDDTAVNGTNYQIVEPSDAVLAFSATDTLKYITVRINRIPGYVEPGSIDFKVEMTTTTGGVKRGGFNSMPVSIVDIDHPLAELFGTWTVDCVGITSNTGATKSYSYEMSLSAYPGDVTRLLCNGICPMAVDPIFANFGSLTVFGNVSSDLSSISFPVGQKTECDLGADNGGVLELAIAYWEGEPWYLGNGTAIVFDKVTDGKYKTEQGIAFLNDYVWPNYGGFIPGTEMDGGGTTWTKK